MLAQGGYAIGAPLVLYNGTYADGCLYPIVCITWKICLRYSGTASLLLIV